MSNETSALLEALSGSAKPSATDAVNSVVGRKPKTDLLEGAPLPQKPKATPEEPAQKEEDPEKDEKKKEEEESPKKKPKNDTKTSDHWVKAMSEYFQDLEDIVDSGLGNLMYEGIKNAFASGAEKLMQAPASSISRPTSAAAALMRNNSKTSQTETQQSPLSSSAANLNADTDADEQPNNVNSI